MKLARTHFEVIVVDKELGLGGQILTGHLEGFDSIVLDIVSPIEPVVAPVEVQSFCRRLCGCAVVGGVAVVVGCAAAEGTVVHAAHQIRAVGDGLVDDVVTVGHHFLLSEMISHAFDP